MCYDDNARPPVPATAHGSAHGEDIVLTASDGNRFAAYAAYPDQPLGAQVIIYPDVRGLHQFYKELALRFAESGVQAVAIDYFGRTAGLTTRDDSFEYMPHVQKIQTSSFFSDVQAALDFLHAGEPGALPTFTVGFCLGGTFSLLTATQSFGLAGVVGFYAGLTRNLGGEGTALDRASEIKYPVLGLFGGADQGIPVEQVHELEKRLNSAGVENTIVIYPNAPHSFFDRRATDHAEASSDAWHRIFHFIEDHKKQAS
jgi:carboxymethylenebutenolidase